MSEERFKHTLASRRTKAVESFANAADAIGDIHAGMSVFALTRGQWSMIDAVLHVLDCVGLAEISVWTWTVAEYEIGTLTRLRNDRRLTGGRLVIDAGARRKNAAIIADWKAAFGSDSVRYVRNHAKIATIKSASGLRLLLRGSMNLNFNPRFEQFDLTEGGADFDLIEQVEMGLPILNDDCTNQDVLVASGVMRSFAVSDLEIFAGVKVWQK